MPAAFSWLNHAIADVDAAIALVVSGSITAAFDSAYPASAALDPDPSKVSRIIATTSGAGATGLTIRTQWSTTANSKTARAAAFVNVRIPAGLTGLAVTAKLITFAGGSAAAAQQTYAAADLVPRARTPDRYRLPFTFAADTACAGIDLDITTTQTWTDYVEIGHPWVGPALWLADGIGNQWRRKPIDESPRKRGPSGSFAAQRLQVRDQIRIPLSVESYNTVLGTPGSASVASLRMFAEEAGLSAPVLVLPRTNSMHELQRLGLYGSIEALPEEGHLGGNLFDADMVVEEIR